MDKGILMRAEILKAIRQYTADKGYSPSIREIAAMVGAKSTSPVKYHLDILAADGLITYSPNIHRSIMVVEK